MKMWTVHLDGGPRRVNHAAIAVRDKIYSFGGYCTGEDYDNRRPMDVHTLCTVTLRWKLLPAVNSYATPYQRYGHSAVAYEDAGYVWGGRNDSDGACNKLYKYCTRSGQWSQLHTNGNTPEARDGHSACMIRDKMYIFGGYEESVGLTVVLLNPDVQEFANSVDLDETAPVGAVSSRFSNEVYSFHFASSTWTLVKQYGTPARWRDFHTAVGIGHVMYVFGGRGDLSGDIFTNREIYDNKIVAFDTETRTWHQPVVEGPLPVGRRSHSVCLVEATLCLVPRLELSCVISDIVTHQGKMYIFGGYNGQEFMHLNDIYEYDPEKCHWSLVDVHGVGPCARRRQCCCKVNSRVFLFGGTSPSSPNLVETVDGEIELTDLSDLHILDLEPSLKTLAQVAVLKYSLDTSCLPRDLRWEMAAITTPNCISRPANSYG